jgi:1-acyl-sn-glycerol-3-phosphate acyltransferase
MFASNHRNGAIDGYVLSSALPRFRAIAGKNLTGSIISKLYFGGHIEIYRHAETSEDRAFNQKQLKLAAELMEKRECVLIFPEGTSKLGPSLLPVQKGAAFICKSLVDSIDESTPVYIVPVGLHYEAGWQFRSAAEMHIGSPIAIDKENSRKLTELTEKIKDGMLSVSENFESAEEQSRGEKIAALIQTYAGFPSHLKLCRLAENIPDAFKEKFDKIMDSENFGLYNGAPIIKSNGIWKERIHFWLLTPIVLAAFILNIVPLLISYIVSKKLSDDNNVVTLWKMLVGTPIFLIQWLAVIISAFYRPWFIPVYAVISFAGLYSYDLWRSSRAISKNLGSPRKAELINFSEEFLSWMKQS